MDPLPPLDETQLQTAVHAALSDWTRGGHADSELRKQLLLVRERLENPDRLESPFAERQAINELLEEGLTQLAEHDSMGAAVLRARFFDGEITRQVAARMHASPDQVNRWQRSAIESVTGILFAREMTLRETRSRALLDALPAAPYTRLFGMQAMLAEVAEQLMRPGEPLVIALSGIGGIGKTSLADAGARFVARTLAFEQIVWIRAVLEPFAGQETVLRSWQQVVSALNKALDIRAGGDSTAADLEHRLAEALHSRPILVILDNIEQETQTVHFLEMARRLAGPTKFLLTTRARPTVSAPAYFRSLEELTFSDAADLLRYQARETGTAALEEATDQDLEAIYDVTGGNPLALRLVASLTAVIPLRDILDGLARSRPGPIENMYRAIYWEAWRSLSPDSQALLQAMPLTAETGALPEQMQAISGLAEDPFWAAVRELFARSLLEVRGSVHERRYSIHRLTETFLRTEIVDWPEKGERPSDLSA